ncbi:glycosyltransferase family 4 protein [Geovibrio thiophilus]|uniref:glycosyltransferase family 4 protein n=1 Tax=Geovibrio thiophilus TaxID=139438 RepID=UPI0013E2B87E|nr:glycosyltransferase family 4 protein [Geovibrio thiophilus]
MRIALAQRKILGKNGTSRIIAEQSKIFKESGHEVFIYCVRCETYFPDSVRVKKYFSLSPFRSARRNGYSLGYEKFCRRNSVDLSVGNGDTVHQDVLFMHNILELEHKLVYGDEAHRGSDVFKAHDRILTEKNFRVLICNSNMMKNFFRSKYAVPEEKTRVLYPGYDPHLFNTEGRAEAAEYVRRKHSISRRSVIGFISSGNLAKRGIDVLIKTASVLDADISSETALLLVGKDKNTDNYKLMILEANPRLEVITAGAVNDVEKYFKTCDVLLHPAHIEEFGMTVTEAMACGTPVLTSRMVGASEIFTPEMEKYLTDKPDADFIAAQTAVLLKNREEYAALASMSAEAAKACTWDEYFRELFQIYSDFSLLR